MTETNESSAPLRPLAGRVCVVAGATRGAGRAIAVKLGEAGATVYCTGRSVRGRTAMEGRPECIEETAELVTARGGRGVAVPTDHTVEAQVKALFERVEAEAGRLDVLVNDVWGGDELVAFGSPFWEVDPERARTLLERAVFSHLLTSRYGAPIMVRQRRGLIVEVTDGDSLHYRLNLAYDLVKVAVIRLAYGMAEELAPHGVTALAVTPGFLRSEAMLELFDVTEANWQEGAKKEPHFVASETPYFVGAAVAALAADPDVHRKAGGAFASWTLSDEYGFADADGRRPHWGNYAKTAFPEGQPYGAPKTGILWRAERV